MSLIPTVYKSSDPGAPALTGQVGSLVGVLRAVLVTGYGSAPNVVAGAGWTESFTGTNKAVFRNNPVSGTGAMLRIDDTATAGSANARSAFVRAYETMSDVDTGTGPAPTVAQVTNGLLMPKSKSLDSVARAWVAIANERFCYLFTDPGSTTSGWIGVAHFPLFFGDLVSRKPGDAFHFCVIGSQLTSITGIGVAGGAGLFQGERYSSISSSGGCVYLLRAQSQAAGAKAASFSTLSDGGNSGAIGYGGTYPDPISGGLCIERVMIVEASYQIRGFLPNVYGTTNGIPFADMSIRTDIASIPSGTQILAKSFSQWVGANGFVSTYGQVLFDITNPWSA